MRVFHFVPLISKNAGGVCRCVQGMVEAMCDVGADAWLICCTRNQHPWFPGIKHHLSRESFSSVEELLKEYRPDLVHINDLWQPSLHNVCRVCRKLKIPYVLSPHGTLEPWSLRHKWLKKRIARFLYQDADIKKAIAIHATADSEKEHIRALGFKGKCFIVENGVTLPHRKINHLPFSKDTRRFLFVGRLNPKKGVLELVNTLSGIDKSFWRLELVYTISVEEERLYEQVIKNRVAALGLSNNVTFTGALDDEGKWAAYERADIFILPTYSENFGIVVAEALWAGVPVITTKGTPWAELEEAGCGYWVDVCPSSGCWVEMKRALEKCIRSNIDHLKEMGERGHKLVQEKYSWSGLAGKLLREYENIISAKA